MTLFHECLNLYVESMHKSINQRSSNEDAPYFSESELETIQENAKEQFLSEFQKKRQLGGDEIMQPFRNKLAIDIEIKYRSFKQQNEGRRNTFIVSILADSVSFVSKTIRQQPNEISLIVLGHWKGESSCAVFGLPEIV